MSTLIWHDVECGAYDADLPLWRALARESGGPVLDVGAGSGRVTLDLAGAGYAVTALDIDAGLLAALRERAAELPVTTLEADAAEFDAGERAFGLVAVPMQTIQLLPGKAARQGFFAAARRAVKPGGIVALAITDHLEPFEQEIDLPEPDALEVDGWRYLSQPTAVRATPGGAQIERLRHTIAPDGERTVELDQIVLAHVTVSELHAEGGEAGLRPDGARRIAATADHVGSEVVLLRG